MDIASNVWGGEDAYTIIDPEANKFFACYEQNKRFYDGHSYKSFDI